MEPNLSLSPGSAVGSAVVDQLARTKGWTRFFSILMWIGAVFLLLGGAVMVFMGLAAGATSGQIEEQLAAVGGGLGIGVVYLVMAFFYIYPALKLGGYSSRIGDLMNAPNEANLIAALNEQRAFWKYVGILMIVMFVFYAIAIVVMIVGVAAAAAAGTAGVS